MSFDRKIVLKDIKVNDDPFYTNVVLFYTNKINVHTVSSDDDIELLRKKVLEMSEKEPIAMNCNSIINSYFTALNMKFRDTDR